MIGQVPSFLKVVIFDFEKREPLEGVKVDAKKDDVLFASDVTNLIGEVELVLPFSIGEDIKLFMSKAGFRPRMMDAKTRANFGTGILTALSRTKSELFGPSPSLIKNLLALTAGYLFILISLRIVGKLP